MSLKIEANTSVTAYHVIDGPRTFPYAIDARSAVSRFPQEWSLEPWSGEAAKTARQFVIDRHARETADAEARKNAEKSGLPAPLSIAPEVEPTPEEQAAIDEHAKAVAEANERLKARREKLAAEKAEADQVAADEALVASVPPTPDPTRRAPTKKEKREEFLKLTPEEQAEKDAREKAADDAIAAKKAADAKLVQDKADADKQAAAAASVNPAAAPK